MIILISLLLLPFLLAAVLIVILVLQENERRKVEGENRARSLRERMATNAVNAKRLSAIYRELYSKL